MKVHFAAPKQHLQHVLDEFDFEYVDTIGAADAWVVDPLVSIAPIKIRKYKNLKYIATPSTGTNHLPMYAIEKEDLKLFSLLDNREGLDTITASSEFTLWHILNALRLGGFRMFRNYDRNDDVMRGNEISGKTIGFVGMGRIGRNVSCVVDMMGATVNYSDPNIDTPFYWARGNKPLEDIFQNDIVVVSCALTDETRGMITREHLKDFNGILVNTARAEIVVEPALLKWCANGGRYSTDVLHGETKGKVDSPLLSMPNVYVTPHIAGTTFESQEKAARIILRLLWESETDA